MNTGKSVGFFTLGCKLNFSETSAIARAFAEKGFSRVDFEEKADFYVINTCSVTDNADKECRRIVRKALKTNPDSRVIVVGCYAQLKPKEIASIDGVSLVLGASEKFKVTEYLEEIEKSEKALVYSCDIHEVESYTMSFSMGDRTRAFLKVQDGCDYSCTYCTIPLARGKSRSNTIENTLETVHELASKGVKEVVLTGVNTGDFGKSLNSGVRKTESFLGLIKELDKVEGIHRFRISSIEPNLLHNEIIEFVASSQKFVPHFHIPLQSGSDEILKSMKRRYLSGLYKERVMKIKDLMPHCCIGADVITGFPGETEKEFEETYAFLNDLDVSYLHVFTYSERPDTEAILLPNSVPMAVRQERTSRLRILSEKKKRNFYAEHQQTTREVLFEEENDKGFMKGYTDNYIQVRTPYNPELVNTTEQVFLENITPEGFMNISIPVTQ